MAESFGIATLDWAEPKTLEEATGVFQSWELNSVLKKKSHTCGGNGIDVVSSPKRAVCENDEIINRLLLNETPLYKIELIGENDIISWIRAEEIFSNKVLMAPPQSKSRAIWSPPEEILQKAKALGKKLGEMGAGHIALDYLRDENGNIKLIEVNTHSVALWWV